MNSEEGLVPGPGGRADEAGVVAQAGLVDGRAGERDPVGALSRLLHGRVQKEFARRHDPAAEEDPFRVQKVDDDAEADAQIVAAAGEALEGGRSPCLARL